MWLLPLLIVLAIALWLSLQTAQFLNGENLLNLVPQAMPLVITAVGQMFVILLGGLDLSVGSMISFTTAVLALGGPAWALIPAVFVLAALVGFSNGFIITRFNVHPIIAADFSPGRRALALQMGADIVIDPGETSPYSS